MASIRMWAFFSVAAAILFILPAITHATDYVVGDNNGWTTGFDYSEWAKDKKFRVGDALIFIYSEGYHSVAKVDGKGFGSCSVPPNATVLTSGNDKITLTTTGNKWYICGVSGHCEAGQKLKITVLPKSMIGGPPSPAPEVMVPGFSSAPVPVATPGYLPEDMMNSKLDVPGLGLAMSPMAPAPVETPWYLPGFPWAPTPVEAPGSMPGEEEGEALQTMPTMPPGTWVPPELVWPPAMPPVAGGPWSS
ncbi:hypothetical protein AAC387_Pa05g3075 [Persea americana]